MAPRTTACPKCRTQLDISGFKPGQRIRCGACNTVLRIPGEVPVSAPVSSNVSQSPGSATSGAAIPATFTRTRMDSPANATRAVDGPSAALPEPPAPPRPAGGGEETDPNLGKTIGGEFEIVKKLGEGGYGAVYEATDRTLRRRVAIKLMLAVRASNAEYVSKFKREAQTAAKISHPNIVAIHAVGFEAPLKTYYLAMEYVEGRTLHDILQERGPMDEDECVDVISQCCRGLGVAHRMNIIHRDIKPGNIMITPSAAVKIADFGLAKQLDEGEQAKSMVIGTPFFMPPEQFEGKSKDGRTDIYALGVTLYYMLTMKRPFTGSTPAQILVAIMTKEPTPVADLRPGLSDGIWKVVRRMIHRDLDQRYQDCDQILEDLARLRKTDEGGEKVFCPECGIPNELDASKCKGCSASMRERCPVCGAEEDVGVKFCGECGANIPLEKEVKGLANEAKALLASGDFLKAIEKAKEAREKSPDNSEIISLQSEAESRRDGLDKERSAVSALLAAGDFDRAEERVKSALATYPNEPHLLTLKGDLDRTRAAMRRGHGKLTVETLLKASRFAEAREACERLMMSEGRTPELLALLARAEGLVQELADKTEKARALDKSGDGTGAFEAWKLVLAANPGNPEAQERIRKHEDAKGEVVALLAQVEEILGKGDPEEAVKRLGAATGRTASDARVRAAVTKAKDAVKDLEAMAKAVRARIAKEEMNEAEKAREALVKKYPGARTGAALESEIRSALRASNVREGEANLKTLLKEKRWAAARDAATALLGEDPESEIARDAAKKAGDTLTKIADLLAKGAAAEPKGELEEAEEAYEEVLELSPGQTEAAAGLERVSAAKSKVDALRKEAQAAEKSDPARAAELWKKVAEAAPADAEAATAAKRLSEKVAGRVRDVSDVEEMLAAGEVDDALDRCRALEKKYPGDADAKELLQIAERLIAARDELLARAERLLKAGHREKEARLLVRVALRVLPGDPKAAALMAKAKAGPETTP